jgi:hypothetical protein
LLATVVDEPPPSPPHPACDATKASSTAAPATAHVVDFEPIPFAAIQVRMIRTPQRREPPGQPAVSMAGSPVTVEQKPKRTNESASRP